MTRCDNCGDCGEQVGDCDVCCAECSESYCSECIRTYNPITRICKISARYSVFAAPFISHEELVQFCTDLQHESVMSLCAGIAQHKRCAPAEQRRGDAAMRKKGWWGVNKFQIKEEEKDFRKFTLTMRQSKTIPN